MDENVTSARRRDPETIVVAAAIICVDGRYLIARRKPDVHLAGYWEFPGGKCEPGEALETCLIRELREELDVSISALVPFRVVRHSYPEKTVELHFFRCEIVAGEATTLDCAEVRWVNPEDFHRYRFPPADEGILQALQPL